MPAQLLRVCSAWNLLLPAPRLVSTTKEERFLRKVPKKQRQNMILGSRSGDYVESWFLDCGVV
jgi:hypothetical protein